jgi:hypothetical protein
MSAQLFAQMAVWAITDITRNLPGNVPDTAFAEIEIDRRFPAAARRLGITVTRQQHHWDTIARLRSPSSDATIALTIAQHHYNGISDCAFPDAGGVGEVAKFDEGGSVRKLARDKHKNRFITTLTGIPAFVGAYLTDTQVPYMARLPSINAALKSEPVVVNGPFRSRDGAWRWAFAVWAFGPADFDLSDPDSADIVRKASRPFTNL